MNIEGLSLDHMRAALAVARSGSFSAAARELNRTQSAVSYAVSALEQQIGVALFDRVDGKPPFPTEAGRVIFREMEVVLRQANHLKEAAKAVAAGLEPEVALVLDSHFPLDAIVPTLQEFQRLFPAVQLRLAVEAMGAVLEEVRRDSAALGVTASAQTLPAEMIGDALAPITRIPVVAAHHALAVAMEAQRPVPHGVLLEHVQIVQSDRSEATRERDYTVHASRTWRVTDLFVKHTLLLAGLGWGYMPEHLVAADLAEGRLKQLRAKGLREANSVAAVVIRMRDRLLGPAGQWLLTQLLRL